VRALAPLLLVGLVACGSGRSAASGCGSPVHDPFDPRSVTHVLPGAKVPPFITDPPTSGEHQPVDVHLYRGVLARPVLPQIQVALLESSQVLVQYRTSIGVLGPLASNKLVTIAPDPTLASPVVATAWTWRLVCGASPSLSALQAFITVHAGAGPQAPPP
jgi:hypothetical protein